MPSGLWVEQLTLTNFRSYASAVISTDSGPQVIVGANGSGKTNLLEALSLLSPGQGLRRIPFVDLARTSGDGGFAIAALAYTLAGPAGLGTGLAPCKQESERGGRSGRIVRIDGSAQSGVGILADYLEIVWLTPAMDGLFTGPASERRRFLDRLILCFDHSYQTIARRFERAMTSRNRLLADGICDNAQLSSFEQVMAKAGIAVAAARLEAIAAMTAIVAKRRARDPDSAFPWSAFRLEGTIEDDLSRLSAVEVEDAYARTLRETRERDRGMGRTLDGPHRSDLIVEHGPKALEARHSSTGEQKALLLGLILAHAELLTERQEGVAPILLFDEITAHLDIHRRVALFEEILRLGAQAWMTGTDADDFSALSGKAQFWWVNEGKIEALP